MIIAATISVLGIGLIVLGGKSVFDHFKDQGYKNAEALVCAESEYPEMNSLTLFLKNDGKTIEKVEAVSGFNKDQLLNYLEAQGLTEESMETEWNRLADEFTELYYQIMDGNTELSWFENKLSINEELKEITMKSKIDLSDPSIDLTNPKTKDFLWGFGIDDFSNEDHTYTVTPDKVKIIEENLGQKCQPVREVQIQE